MTKEDLNLIYEFTWGSRCHNLITDRSDKDIHGIFVQPKGTYISMKKPIDFVRYSEYPDNYSYTDIKCFFNGLKKGYPSFIEYLYLGPNDIIKSSPAIEKIIANRDIFISKELCSTFIGLNRQDFLSNGLPKKVMHYFRWTMSLKSLLTNGLPIIRFEDGSKDRELLINIRLGKVPYADLEAISFNLLSEIKTLKDASNLPNTNNEDKINDLFDEIMAEI